MYSDLIKSACSTFTLIAIIIHKFIMIFMKDESLPLSHIVTVQIITIQALITAMNAKPQKKPQKTIMIERVRKRSCTG